LLLCLGAVVFGLATAITKKQYVYSGRIAEVNQHDTTMQLAGSDGQTSLRLRYDEGTKFLEADRHVVPSFRLIGMRAQVLYKKSLFAGDHALRVEVRE